MMDLLLARRRMMMQQAVTPTANYLTFTAAADSSSVALTIGSGSPTNANLEYAVNGGSFSPYVIGTVISLDNGDYVEMKRVDGSVITQLSTSGSYYQFAMTGTIAASGNVMSLLDATCEALTVGDFCFYALFYGCSSLVTAPEMPATTLGLTCYRRMYYGCSSLVAAPELPCLAVPDNGYREMFRNCSALNYVKMHAMSLGSNALLYWLGSVAAAGDLYCDNSLTLPSGGNGIPNGWTRYNLDGTPY